jgi:hypothetical protein
VIGALSASKRLPKVCQEDYSSGRCWGAIGVLQRIITMAYSDSSDPILDVCVPPKSTRTQLVAIFVEYVRRNPQRLHEDFFDVSIDALRGAFPCQPHPSDPGGSKGSDVEAQALA